MRVASHGCCPGCVQGAGIEVALQRHLVAHPARASPMSSVQSSPTASAPMAAMDSSQLPPPLVKTMLAPGGLRVP